MLYEPNEQWLKGDKDMSSTISKSDITEEVYYVWQCPSCSSMSDVYDESDIQDTVVCDHCHDVFTVIDD